MDKLKALEWFLRRRSMGLSDRCQEAEDVAIEAIRAIIAQEPRVMEFSEIMAIYNADPFHVWPYNTPPFLYIQEHPHVRHSSESWAAWREIKDIIEGELFGHTAKSYGVTWRCWNRKPTNELREAVKWE